MKYSRRNFIKTSGLVLGTLPFASMANSINLNRKIKVGLIGCGGRGVGALIQAMSADPDVIITALADVFPEQVDQALKLAMKKDSARVDVPKERQFLGFESYKDLIDTDVDIVLLCSPPNFRPDHIEYAVSKGKHIFCEKPVAIDIPGLKRVMETVKIAKEKNLNIVSGFCFRYLTPNREIMKRVAEGDIGEVKSVTTFRCGGENTLKLRLASYNEMQYQLKNWYYFQRYAADLIVEQTVHSLDYMNWIMNNKLPKSVFATGGRQTWKWDAIGNGFDHFAVEYDYGNGVKGVHFGRQQSGTDSRNSVEVLGSKGNVEVNLMSSYKIHGEKPYEFSGNSNNMYQTQHDELLAAVRSGNVINDGDHMVNSTLLAIWGKISAYTGKRITYEQIMSSKEVLSPLSKDFSWDMPADNMEIARPGMKSFV
ncbi:Gfo/Idh/MocA family protein [Sphingobacterium litopenaei]|uniref:Gfo/Idh/MocA family oxidoreductase n=1 Tax=Sphingobacterium litopenaei TaxID=2763500 RepID=A0ABR7YB79_9SPHI|nr:Gfo/Idh/MocA family oxidoreductase [Sphingobacterium litopenaei]MBD1428558.1 Gfo/Idh/MocA family oxidoreductase [Sphingobacterium litopenaei]